MNRKCAGIFFEDLEEYRCLLDGSFIKMKKPEGNCPNCNREILHQTENVRETKSVLVTYIRSDTLGWIEKSREKEDQSKVIEKLREKIRQWNTIVAARCTPGGSEFHDDPERCARHFKQISESNHNALKSNVFLKRENETLRNKLADWSNKLAKLEKEISNASKK